MNTDDDAQAALEQNGFALALSVMPGQTPGQVTVSVINLGTASSQRQRRPAPYCVPRQVTRCVKHSQIARNRIAARTPKATGNRNRYRR